VAREARLLIAGDMGIANSTAAACLICAITGATPESVVGRGTGVDDAGLARKVEVVQIALARVGKVREPLRLLAELGGLEIAAIAGFYIEAARQGVPVLLDGYISTAAALAAAAIEPEVVNWMLASHRSAEVGHSVALQWLKLEPLLDLRMRLGEGTGAALTVPIVRAALALHARMATFGEAGVSEAIDEGK
jgi:nicotinate-nucleotide--dimethylbenzimidazole phosphoribosyltransferase